MEIAFVILAVGFAVQSVRAWHWRREAAYWKAQCFEASDGWADAVKVSMHYLKLWHESMGYRRRGKDDAVEWPDTIER